MLDKLNYKKELENYKIIMSNNKRYVYSALPEATQCGFEYFDSDLYERSMGNFSVLGCLKSNGLIKTVEMLKIYIRHSKGMRIGQAKCYSDLSRYLDEYEEDRSIPPHEGITWNDLKDYAWNKWGVRIGFTELPQELILKDRAVLFKYAIVCIMEMDMDEMSNAPSSRSGGEALRVYKDLGFAVHDISLYLRNRGVKCQADHPIKGQVNTTPLAGKSGLGWQGKNGLLITPWYGQRQRIAPIFIEDKVFEYTDSEEHRWLEDFCKKCGKCKDNCPADAIYDNKILGNTVIDIIDTTRTCIDREKCFEYFRSNFACAKCIATCPFSKGGNIYHRIKQSTNI